MLQPPYQKYDQLYVYYLDKRELADFSDPDLIGTWIEDESAILFFHQPKEQFVASLCRASGATVVYQAELNYRDWEAGVEITSFSTKRLIVRPVWEKKAVSLAENQGAPAVPRKEILMDPSVIFGSGFHATTRLCLHTLEALFADTERPVRSVLDLGTGTGLLAIAAARLGAERVTALDNNPLAVEVARRNVERNGVSGQVEVRHHDLQQGLPEMGYDLVITNLYKGLLLQLFANSAFWQPRFFMVSGFIPGMEADLLAALPVRNVQLRQRKVSEQWRLWLLERVDDVLG